MIDYLNETYNGFLINPNKNVSYYCYTIKDLENNMYYSGSRTCYDDIHDLSINYFTSSSVLDFVKRFKTDKNKFKLYVEYFNTLEDSKKAEVDYHKKFNVGQNSSFYNVINASGTLAGTGSLLCKSKDNKIYRVSKLEYTLNREKHNHVSKGKINVYDLQTNKIIKINKYEFNSTLHKHELTDKVHVYDTINNVYKRVSKEIFNTDSTLVGCTKGYVHAYNKLTNKLVKIQNSEYSKDLHYTDSTGKVTAYDKVTNEKVRIDKAHYKLNKDKYYHSNTGKIVVFSKELNRYISILRNEYTLNKDKYLNSTSQTITVYDKITKEKIKLLRNDYINNKDKYMLYKTKRVNCFDCIDKKYKQIEHTEFLKYKQIRYFGIGNKKIKDYLI